ncbi:hypothetical protein DL1_02520 [Thioclava dalianensis]|uniref:Magnesium transporter MgtE intracellular domain-containing protein n=1 Tax=Thioclava dalianensis TaxID=1185766 RepID=A0A074TDE9_9RHOB|nr:hypothetical protein [Thioclava dalianensis]KEP69709.1 hypothetical protein DL1_02520 [Thioclava dalianensis]SFM93254.1 Flagellar motility protein MotE, a chaperone for MotC folding [Thioclava dalianensis]
MKTAARATTDTKRSGQKKARGLRRRLGRGLLWIIAGLFVSSGVLRLVEAGGSAIARQTESADAAEQTAGECVTEPGLMALHAELQSREETLADREGSLLDREQAMSIAQTRLEARLAELRAAEEALSQTVTIADQAAEKDVARLVTLYENMKPKQAAPLFEEMSPEFAAGFLGRMRPEAAAAVLSSLDPKSAYTISVLMAGRNAGAPKE